MPREKVHLAVLNSLFVLADPYLAYSATGGLGRAQPMYDAVYAVENFVLFLSQLFHLTYVVFSDSPVHGDSLFGPCDLKQYSPHAPSKDVSGVFLARRRTSSDDLSVIIVPPGLVCTIRSLPCAPDVNMRVVYAAAFAGQHMRYFGFTRNTQCPKFRFFMRMKNPGFCKLLTAVIHVRTYVPVSVPQH